MKVRISFFLMACAVICSCRAAPSQPFSSDVIAGRWSPDCDRIMGMAIDRDQHASVEINSNQIYIRARIQRVSVSPTGYALILEGPDDLGRGGMLLDWTSFSSVRPIARINPQSKN